MDVSIDGNPKWWAEMLTIFCVFAYGKEGAYGGIFIEKKEEVW